MEKLHIKNGYAKYPQYEKSGVDWLGDIPAGWKVRKVKHLFKITKEKSFEENPTILSLTQNGIKVRDISNNEGQLAESYLGYNKVRVNDIILNPMDLKSGFIDCAKTEGVISPAYTTLRSIKPLVHDYYKYYFQWHYYDQILFPFGEGVSVDHRWTLKNEDLLNFPILEPDMNSQNVINKYLSVKTKLVESIIDKKLDLVKKLEEKRKSVVDNIIFRTQGNPNSNNSEKIKFIANLRTEKQIGNDEALPYVALENIESWTGNLLEGKYDTEFESIVNKFYEGDVLFGKLRPYLAKAICCTFAGLCAGELLVLNPNPKKIIANYLLYVFLSEKIISEINNSTFGAKMPRADWKFIGNIKITYPKSIESQRRIVHEIKDEISTINQQIKKIRQSMENLEKYKIAMISQTVTGKIKA